MEQRQVVTGDGSEFWVELTTAGGPATIKDNGALSFDGVRGTIENIAAELSQTWQRVKPSEASVEFALKLTVKSGKLTGLLVEGGGEAALKVTLTWKPDALTAARLRDADGD